MIKSVSLIFCMLLSGLSSFSQGWSSLGVNNPVLNLRDNDIYTICADNRGNLYAAGMIYDTSWHTIIGKWDGTSWTALGEGSILLDSFSDITQVLADTSGNLYAVGQDNNVLYNYVLKWDGTSWGKVGTGASAYFANGQIMALCFDKYGNLYAAGAFTDGITDTSGHYYVAKWDGTSWSEIGTGAHALNANNVINTVFVDTFGNVYAAGAFTDSATYAGGNVYVAKWDGISWSELGSGVSHQVDFDAQIFSILVDTGGNVYAAGYLITDSGYSYVAKWDGTSWSKLGTGSHALNANGGITTLCADIDGNLYAAGWFTDDTSAYSGRQYVAKWDGVSWSELGGTGFNFNPSFSNLYICSDPSGNIYAGGARDTAITLYDSSFSYNPVYVAEYRVSASVAPVREITGIRVYPNPAHSIINVILDNTSTISSNTGYSLYDVTGKICRSGKLQPVNTTINIEELSPGTYILHIGNGKAVYKVVKE